MDKVTRALKTGGVVMGLNAVGAIRMVPNDFGNAFKNGVISVVANDVVNYVETRQSDIVNMDYKQLIDKLTFSTLFFTAVEFTDVDKFIGNALRASPFPKLLIKPAVVSGLMTANELLRAGIDESPYLRNITAVNIVTHPSNLLF